MKELKPIPTDMDVIFTSKNDGGYCEYCGISFTHIHRAGTLPRDFERAEEPEWIEEVKLFPKNKTLVEHLMKKKEPEKCECKHAPERMHLTSDHFPEQLKRPEPKQEPWEEKFDNEFRCLSDETHFYTPDLEGPDLVEGMGQRHYVKKEVKSFIRNLLREEKEKLKSLIDEFND